MKEKKSTSNIFSCFVKGLDLPVSAISGESSVELIGNKRVIVENAKRIIEYENNIIRLDTDKFNVVINGTQLTFNSYSDKIVVIDGNIKNVCLE